MLHQQSDHRRSRRCAPVSAHLRRRTLAAEAVQPSSQSALSAAVGLAAAAAMTRTATAQLDAAAMAAAAAKAKAAEEEEDRLEGNDEGKKGEGRLWPGVAQPPACP